MVRSMMSQTTLPKSFWDYALERLACTHSQILFQLRRISDDADNPQVSDWICEDGVYCSFAASKEAVRLMIGTLNVLDDFRVQSSLPSRSY
ncbi:hypothetical protein Tco_0744989 [Tanacetum coccineum]